MATDLEKLVVQLSADIKQYERAMQRAQGVTNAQARAIENRYKAMDARLGQIGQSAARGLIAPLTGVAAALSVQEVMHYADAWTKAKNSLAVAGITGKSQAGVLEEIYQSAQKAGAPVGALADLFGKAKQANDNLQASQQDLLQFTDGIATALKVEGKSASEASGALTQLGQLLGSARVQAEEFNSVNEGARTILIAVANGLDEAGGSVNKLKQLVNDGAVSGKQFFNAFLRGLPAIQGMAANSTQTIEQGMTKVNNAFTKYIGGQDQALGASGMLAAGLNALADDFENIADKTLKLAAIISGALVGRAIGGAVVGLGTASIALLKFAQAAKAAKTVGDLRLALGGIGAAAGPIGAVVGTIAAGAITYFGAQAVEASARTERLKAEIADLSGVADGVAGSTGKAAEAMNKLAPEALRKRLADINAEMDRLKERSWSSLFGAGDETLADIKHRLGLQGKTRNGNHEAARDLLKIVKEAEDGKLSLDEVKNKLDAVANTKPGEAIDAMIASLREIIPYMDKLGILAKKTADEMTRAGDASRTIFEPADKKEWRAQRDAAAEKNIKDQRIEDAGRTDQEKELDARVDAVIEAFKKAGLGITRAAAEVQARAEIAAEKGAQGLGGAVSGFVERTVTAESGGKADAKNPNSSATGLGQFIESTWLALFRKYFPGEADGMSREAILAMRTDAAKSKALIEAYARENAAILQKAGISVNDAADEYKLQLAHFLGPQGAINVLKAAPGTKAADVLPASAVKANPTILGGGRTVDDVIAYGQRRAGMQTAGTAKLDARDDLDSTLKSEERQLDMLREETALRGQLNPLVEDYGQKLATFQKAQELLTDAQRDGSDAGKELSSVQQLLNGDLSQLSPIAEAQALRMRQIAEGYGAIEAAANRAAEAQGQLREQAREFRDTAKDAFGGFVKDLAHGVDAAEALKSAVGRIADKLLDVGINLLFDGAKAGSGGGLLGKIFSGFSGVKLAGGGTVRGPGTSTSDSVPAMLSDGEHVTRAAMAKKYPGLLAAINADRVPHLAAGGTVMRLPRASTLRAMAQPKAGDAFAPTYNIDARGSQMSEADFRRVLDGRDRKIIRDVRGKVSSWVQDDQERRF